MKAIVTVIGKDKVGIICQVSAFLAQAGVNVEEVSQTVMSDYFMMLMLVDISKTTEKLSDLSEKLEVLGSGQNLNIRILHEDIFNAMHKI